MPLPKFLKQTTTGDVYTYTDILAQRADMVGYNPDTEKIVEKKTKKSKVEEK